MNRVLRSPLPAPTAPDLPSLRLVALIIEDQVERHTYFVSAAPWFRRRVFALAGHVCVVESKLFVIRPENARQRVAGTGLSDDIEQLLCPGLHLGDKIK